MYAFGPAGMSRPKAILAINLSQMIVNWPRLGGRRCEPAEELSNSRALQGVSTGDSGHGSACDTPVQSEIAELRSANLLSVRPNAI
jgi:hypothetical protein